MITRSPSQAERQSTSPRARALRLWESSFELALAIFRIADRLPRDIAHGLGAQMRFVALSVSAHIARGHSGLTSRAIHRGLCQARGDLFVLTAKVSACAQAGYVTEPELQRAEARIREMSLGVDSIIADIRRATGVGGLGSHTPGAGLSRVRGVATSAVR